MGFLIIWYHLKISSYCNFLFYSTCFLACPITFYILPQHCLSFTRHHKMTCFLADLLYPSLPYSIDILLYNLTGSGIVYIKVNQFSSRLWTVVQFSRVQQLVICTVCRIYIIVELGLRQWIAIEVESNQGKVYMNFWQNIWPEERERNTIIIIGIVQRLDLTAVLLLHSKCVLNKS